MQIRVEKHDKDRGYLIVKNDPEDALFYVNIAPYEVTVEDAGGQCCSDANRRVIAEAFRTIANLVEEGIEDIESGSLYP